MDAVLTPSKFRGFSWFIQHFADGIRLLHHAAKLVDMAGADLVPELLYDGDVSIQHFEDVLVILHIHLRPHLR